MTSYASEYSGGTVGSGGCSYATLCAYNQGYGAGAMAPVPVGTPSMAVQVVPTFNGLPGYNTLTHNKPYGCGGYFNIQDAYPNFPSNCSKYTQRLCGSGACGQ